MADDLQSRASEMMKKVLTVGVGTLFLTEEALRGLVSEFKLPKELLGSVLDSANRTKNEFLGSLSRELMAKINEKVDPRALIDEILAKHEIEFTVKVSFSPKKTDPKPESGSGSI
jgi:hypothetical protein